MAKGKLPKIPKGGPKGGPKKPFPGAAKPFTKKPKAR